MPDEWGPWIEHDGLGMPQSIAGMYGRMRVEFRSGEIKEGEGIIGALGPLCWDWSHYGRPAPDGYQGTIPRLTHYRIRKPRALEQLREIARNPEIERARELEDA